jgi:hypothetical protein
MIRNLWLAQFLKEFVSRMLGLQKEGIFLFFLQCSPAVGTLGLIYLKFIIIRQPVAATLHFLVICIHKRTCGWPMVCAAYLLAR